MSQTEEHIIIRSDRSIIVPIALQRIAVLEDHNVETVTFDCPRYWDGHDMSTPDWNVHINYMLANGILGTFKAEDVSVDISDESVMHFTWTIMAETTQIPGPITFMVCIRNVDSNGKEIRHWNSDPCSDMRVSDGLEPDATVILPQADILTQILQKLEVADIMVDELNHTLGGVVESIPDTVPMRDADGYLHAATPDENADGDTVANKEYVGKLRSYIETKDAAIRSEFAAADAAIRVEFAAEDAALKQQITNLEASMGSADEIVLNTVRSEMAAADETQDERLTTLEKTVTGESEDDETSHEYRIGALETGYLAIETSVETLGADVELLKDVETTVSTHTTEISELETSIAALEAADETLAESMTTAHNEMSQAINQNASDIDKLETEDAAIRSEFATADENLLSKIENLITFSQVELTPGTSSLATGKLYVVYE